MKINNLPKLPLLLTTGLVGLLAGLSLTAKTQKLAGNTTPVIRTHDLQIIGQHGEMVAEIKAGDNHQLIFFNNSGAPAATLGLNEEGEPKLWLAGLSAKHKGVSQFGALVAGPGPYGVWGITGISQDGSMRELTFNGKSTLINTFPPKLLSAMMKNMRSRKR